MSDGVEELSGLAQTMLYVCGVLGELSQAGLIKGGFEATEKGMAAYWALKAQGYEPVMEEMGSALGYLLRDADEATADAIVALVWYWVYGRQEVAE